MKVGVGSRVESAEAPVSPRSSPPKLPDFRLGRGILVWREICHKRYPFSLGVESG